MRSLLALLLVLVFSFLVPDVVADEGNGVGGAVLVTTVAPIVPGGGGVVTIDFGQVGGGFGANALLVLSDGLGPVIDPTVGPICIDLNSPTSQIIASANLAATQTFPVSFVVPDVPTLPSFAPLYLLNFTFDSTLPFPFLSMSKTVRLSFENVDSYSATTGSMLQARALHTATALQRDAFDNRTGVLVTGGGAGSILAPVATDTTELFDDLRRVWTSGPLMSTPRALHAAVRLQDGRVLVCGGTDNAGTVLAAAEIYDPATGQFVAAAPMNALRAGHALTVMPDGRVLATGGVTTFAGGSAALVAILQTAQASAELYDPMSDTWTPVPGSMSAPRFGHAQVLLNDGRVMVTGGIDGAFSLFGQGLPTYTASCDFFDTLPTPALTPAPSLPSARGAHQVALLPNGDVLSSGGIVSGFLSVPTPTARVDRFNGSGWSSSAPLPTPVALHTASSTANGVVIHGGINGTLVAPGSTSVAVLHDGATATTLEPIGTNVRNTLAPGMASARGSHRMTRLHDGTYLLSGGADGSTAVATSYIYTLP